MRKIACVLVELEKGERIEDFVKKLSSICNVQMTKTQLTEMERREKIKEILRKLGLTENSNCGGYEYLISAIEIVADNPGMFMSKVYYKLAGMYHEQGYTIESKIRYVVGKIAQNKTKMQAKKVLGEDIKIVPSKLIKYIATMML